MGARWWPKGAPRVENVEKLKCQESGRVGRNQDLGGRQVEPGSGLEWSLVVSGGGRWWWWSVVVKSGAKWCSKGGLARIRPLELKVEWGGRGDRANN